uniref:Uncharacterized protein n=1 Tax=Tanacetum cinerariifolium TaxID=118510 RepID=A0A6L2K4C3_TANCI|nr:hypothetical protein [Tanacetum cinerariifolium]
MLKKGMYDSWKTRIMLYIQGKENGEMLIDSIKNGTFKLAKKITAKANDGVMNITREQTPDDLAPKDRGEGHIAKQCTTKKRLKDSEWFKEKMLLAQAQEARAELHEKQQDFLANRLEENDDYCDDQATASAIFMASLSPARSLNDDTVGLTYDSNTLFEVPDYDTYHDEDVPDYDVKETEYKDHSVSHDDSY